MKKMQLLSIKILNSQYKFVFSMILCLLIYACFKWNIYYTVLCTNDNLPLIAEPKVPVLKGTNMPTPLQMEIEAFLEPTRIIRAQEDFILFQKTKIDHLSERDESLSIHNILLDARVDELKMQKDMLEIENRYAKQQRDLYKEGYEKLAHNYQKDVNSAFKQGGIYFGHVGLATLALCTFGFLILKTK